MKINNENLIELLNYITTSYETITFTDLVNYAIASDLYKDLYCNHFILERVLNEHNKKINNTNY